jgi:hypothetical protein
VQAVERTTGQSGGTQIHRARMRYVDLLNEALEHNLFHDDISIRYVSSLEGKGDLADFASLITSRLQAQNAG